MNFAIGQSYLVNEVVNNVNEFTYNAIDEFYVKVTNVNGLFYLTFNIANQDVTIMFNRRPSCRIEKNADGNLRFFCH